MADNWTPAETALARRLIEHDGLNAQQVAEEFARHGLKRTHQAIRRKKQREGWRSQILPAAVESYYNKQIKLKTDRILLLFDIHSPFHDAGWCNEVINLALRWGVRAVGLGGDVIDWAAFSTWGRQQGLEADQEIESTRQIIKALCNEFETLVWAGGNHELRLTRKLDNLLSLTDVTRMFIGEKSKAQITNLHWFEVESGGKRYYVEHPANTSIHATLVPKKLALKFNTNIIAGHGHGWGMTRDDSGRHWAIDAGICADPYKLAYVQERHSTRPMMQQGAVIIYDGTPILLSPHNIAFYKQIKL